MNKHAYLIVAHNNFYILEKLIRLIDDTRNDIYLHIDKKTKNFDFEYFKNMGINMALDDFGTEYSSIALLRKLKPQWIKIDHTFVRSIQDDEMDQAILEYIMNLSKQTRIKVCVEGVENEEILSVVQTYKPELLQGYYYSRPCPAEEFSKKYFNGKDKTGSYGCLKK